MSDTLARICADKRREIDERRRVVSAAAVSDAASATPPPRGFVRHLRAAIAAGRYGLIAEFKRASPSKGPIRAGAEPANVARAYLEGGASCLSVLTDRPYFQGSDDDLKAVRGAVDLPVLRKDFMLDPYQIAESRALGADCVLLILAALSDGDAHALEEEAMHLGMDVLAEVHDEEELERALKLKAALIGVNNRDLKTLKVDLATGERLIPLIPGDRLAVAESGLSKPVHLARLAACGASCFLVGESLMRSDDIAGATRALLAKG